MTLTISKHKPFALAAMILVSVCGHAQTMDYEQYKRAVEQHNISLKAERVAMENAGHALKSAKNINDPELSISYGNNQDNTLQMGQSLDVELSYTISLGNVRGARIQEARSAQDLAKTDYLAALADLRLEAAQAWSEAWKSKQMLNMRQLASESLQRVAAADSVRQTLGEIGMADALQSKLEAHIAQGDFLQAQADYRNAMQSLMQLCGGETIEEISTAELPLITIDLTPDSLKQCALRSPAMCQAILNEELSQKSLTLVRSSRAPELGLNLGYSYNTEVKNELAPAPQFQGITAGITIPLKVSSLNRGELLQARGEVEQQTYLLEATRQQVLTDLQIALNAYEAAENTWRQFSKEIPEIAEVILDSRSRGYQLGESSLTEYLSAINTYVETVSAYIEACANRFLSQEALLHAIGK